VLPASEASPPPASSPTLEAVPPKEPMEPGAPPGETLEPGAPEIRTTPSTSLDPEAMGSKIRDVILESGLRVIAAEDNTLPVAAIILAVETGSKDDPAALPGLTHALAYHLLLQGNRELAPTRSIATAHGGGGLALLATGVGQVRFESVVPLALFEDALTTESIRLRAPTLSSAAWEDTLAWASRDPPQRRTATGAILAAAYEDPTLAHEGRKITKELLQVDLRTLGSELAQRFRYERCTLVIVAPQSPDATLAMVVERFSDLPPRKRPSVPFPQPSTRGQAPRAVRVPEGDGRVLAWRIPNSPPSLAWARVWCRALNLQKRAAADDRQTKVRCVLDEDPRRPLILIGVGGGDPTKVIPDRIRRLAEGEDRAVLEESRVAVQRALALELRQPLQLARQLATTDPTVIGDTAWLHERTGLFALRDRVTASPTEVVRFEDALAIGHAIRLLSANEDPKQEPKEDLP